MSVSTIDVRESSKPSDTPKRKFIKLSSPNVRRSAVSGKLVYVSDSQLAKEKERAKQLGLRWFE